MINISGKNGIEAKVVQDSISPDNKRILTFELTYMRYIHAEFLTHRMLSRNAASSRAIPVEKMHEFIRTSPATPVVWQKNQPGMQSSIDLVGEELEIAQREWRIATNLAVDSSQALLKAGLHKQWANRVTEPFQMMKVVVTATEWSNFFWLRNHADAQPEIHELARVMFDAMTESVPNPIGFNEWHVPYVKRERRYLNGDLIYLDNEGTPITAEDARIVSASCCAQVSFRKSDDSLEKARSIYARLVESSPVHASPVEHQAMPIESPNQPLSKWFQKGVTHFDKKHDAWSGNFKGWVQFRQLISGHSR